MDYSIYPLGYLGVKNDNHTDFEPCLLIDEYWKQYNGALRNLDIENFHLNVLNYAIDQFRSIGGFNSFVTTNLSLAKLTKDEAKFLLDTIKFIKTGKRDIWIGSWDYILSSKSEESKPYIFSKIDDSLLLTDNEDNEALAGWIGHTNGFQDLIFTLRILFGTVNPQ